MRRLLWLPLLVCGGAAHGDDWPQWMGPNRDNVWRETDIVESFPPEGMKPKWRAPVGNGYSGPAVAGGKVYLTDYRTDKETPDGNWQREATDGTERIMCLDAETGKEIWKHEYAQQYAISYPNGPRCTPLVHEGKVYTLGAEGHLACLDAETGKPVWEKELKKIYKCKSALWGYAAHPLIDGKKLITLAGGEGSHVVALDKDTGEQIWKASTSTEQGYSPPTIIKAGGVRQLILLKPDAVSSVDPETGKEYWSLEYGASNGSIIMSPIVVGDYMYVAGYDKKNMLIKLSKDEPKAETLWRDKQGLGVSPVNVQPMAVDGVIYGIDQSGELRAFELPDAKPMWETPEPLDRRKPLGSGTAFINKNGDRFFLFAETGELVIANLSREGYKEISRTKLLEPTGFTFGRKYVWSQPAYAGGCIFARNDKEIICVSLKK